MPLDEYKRKRQFENTPEPEGKVSSENKSRFVVQRHEARRLHYDLRLEMEGVLKSWAIPKGPSLDSNTRRLAVQTEDHPLEYLTFEGSIPKGNYGAGEMSIWDKGTYQLKHSGSGYKLEFNGDKLKGGFALFPIKGSEKDWLFVKHKDEFEVPGHDSEAPESGKLVALNDRHPRPMLATSHKQAFNRKGWVFEIKWDGYRAMAVKKEEELWLYSRNGHSFNEKFAAVYQALQSIHHDFTLDGEVVLLDTEGVPHFQQLQNYNGAGGELRYYIFDLLYLNGHDIRHLPLTDRKSLIPDLIESVDYLQYCEHIEEDGKAFFESSLEMGLEGVIAKDANSPYLEGSRSEYWLKIKTRESLEAVICGYTEGKMGNDTFGSLILGKPKGDTYEYIGNCGSGFDADTLEKLIPSLKNLHTNKSPFHKKPAIKSGNPIWVKPALICEVEYSEITSAGRLRHPVFKGLRPDKEMKELQPSAKQEAHSEGSMEVDGRLLKFTNLEKKLWPADGITKYDLIDYYLTVSDYILPYLKDRPQNLHRHPNGILSEGFYQKEASDILPPWMESVRKWSESSEKYINYLLCQDTATLLYLANLACIELNPWHSRAGSIDQPDYCVIDLDPGPENSFDQVIEVAQAVKEVLDQGKLISFPKTSGSSGIHIYIPLERGYSYDESREFAHIIANLTHQRLPDISSLDRSPARRKAKIYLDYLQNRIGQTLAAPYCVRPKPGATVSAPLLWDEVKPGLHPSDFHLFNMSARLEEVGDRFQGLFGHSNKMESAIENWEQ